jgi:hypothetical protein
MNLRTLSIGTFNLFNLNEPGLALYRDRDGWSESEYERKIEWTQRSIRRLHPDILGFQELWHRASLARALETAGLSNDYDLLVPEDANGTHIVCAAIVRKGLLVGAPEWIIAFPQAFVLKSAGDDPQTPAISVNIASFSRPVLHFQVRPRRDHDPIHVYVCHLKSKNPTEVFREAWFRADTAAYQKHQTNLGARALHDSPHRRGGRASLPADRTDEGNAHSGDRARRHQRRPEHRTATPPTSSPSNHAIWSAIAWAAAMSASTPPKRCRNTAARGMSTTRTSSRT